MGMSGGQLDGEPMLDMNMTPLIDVLLVLLIMFIITIPVVTHSIDIPLPQANPPPDNVVVDPTKNKLVLTANDDIFWNAEQVTDGQLRSLLEQSLTINPEPELQYEPEPLASYDLSAQVL